MWQGGVGGGGKLTAGVMVVSACSRGPAAGNRARRLVASMGSRICPPVELRVVVVRGTRAALEAGDSVQHVGH